MSAAAAVTTESSPSPAVINPSTTSSALGAGAIFSNPTPIFSNDTMNNYSAVTAVVGATANSNHPSGVTTHVPSPAAAAAPTTIATTTTTTNTNPPPTITNNNNNTVNSNGLSSSTSALMTNLAATGKPSPITAAILSSGTKRKATQAALPAGGRPPLAVPGVVVAPATASHPNTPTPPTAAATTTTISSPATTTLSLPNGLRLSPPLASLPPPSATTTTTTTTTTSGTAAPLELAPTSAATTAAREGKNLSEKKLRRLEKNRLSARACRRRKREATENMLREINVLEGENLRLRLQLQIGEEAEESRTREQTKLTQDLDTLLKSGASEGEIYAALDLYKEKYADYGRDRRSAIEFHLRNIERLLMPTQTTSVIMHAIQGTGHFATNMNNGIDAQKNGAATVKQEVDAATTSSTTIPTTVDPATSSATPDATAVGTAQPTAETVAAGTTGTTTVSPAETNENSCSDPPSIVPAHPALKNSKALHSNAGNNLEPKALFQYLVQHLEVTPSQAAALKDSRFVARELDSCLDASLNVVSQLRQRLAQAAEDMETEFNNVRNILTPTQAAKFLVWVAQNSAAMHMLNELWDRMYPHTHHDDDLILRSNSTGEATDEESP